MESSREIEQRILDFSRQLAEEFGDISCDQFGSPFEAIEVRGAEIGDLLMRGFAGELSRKHLQTPPPDCETACPDCGATGQQKKLRSRKLQTIRGEIEIAEPEYHCHECRRSFFPDGPLDRS
jgi:hypothetical protein